MSFINQLSRNFENEKCMWTESIKSGPQTSWTCNHFQASIAVSSIFWLWLMYFQNMAGCFRWKTNLEFLSRKCQKKFSNRENHKSFGQTKGKNFIIKMWKSWVLNFTENAEKSSNNRTRDFSLKRSKCIVWAVGIVDSFGRSRKHRCKKWNSQHL